MVEIESDHFLSNDSSIGHTQCEVRWNAKSRQSLMRMRRAFEAVDEGGEEDAAAHRATGSRSRAAVLVPLFVPAVKTTVKRRSREECGRVGRNVAVDSVGKVDGDDDDAASVVDGIEVLLCVRASMMRSHAGEVAFPGGKFDAATDASDVETALRESREEVGLRETDVEVIGRLPTIMSRHMVSVRPIVGIVRDGFEVTETSEEEVAETFTAPLEMFLRRENHRHDDWSWPGASRAIRVHYFEHEGRQIWGLTAAILIQVARRVYGREPEFQEKTDERVSVWDVYAANGETKIGRSAL